MTHEKHTNSLDVNFAKRLTNIHAKKSHIGLVALGFSGARADGRQRDEPHGLQTPFRCGGWRRGKCRPVCVNHNLHLFKNMADSAKGLEKWLVLLLGPGVLLFLVSPSGIKGHHTFHRTKPKDTNQKHTSLLFNDVYPRAPIVLVMTLHFMKYTAPPYLNGAQLVGVFQHTTKLDAGASNAEGYGLEVQHSTRTSPSGDNGAVDVLLSSSRHPWTWLPPGVIMQRAALKHGVVALIM